MANKFCSPLIRFNLEEAKAGKEVMTRAGDKVRVVCFDRKSKEFPIVAMVEYNNGEDESIETYNERGENNTYHITDKDLFMVPTAK